MKEKSFKPILDLMFLSQRFPDAKNAEGISNLDLFLVKHYFNEEAGFYSTALVLGKIVTYFTAAIVVVLLPLAVASRNNRSVIRSLFHKSMLYCSILRCLASGWQVNRAQTNREIRMI